MHKMNQNFNISITFLRLEKHEHFTTLAMCIMPKENTLDVADIEIQEIFLKKCDQL